MKLSFEKDYVNALAGGSKNDLIFHLEIPMNLSRSYVMVIYLVWKKGIPWLTRDHQQADNN
eukprot:gene16909-12102_t